MYTLAHAPVNAFDLVLSSIIASLTSSVTNIAPYSAASTLNFPFLPVLKQALNLRNGVAPKG